MTTPAQLAAIEARADAESNYPGAVTIEQSQADVPALLAMVREQRAALERVEEIMQTHETYADHHFAEADRFIPGEVQSRHLERGAAERLLADILRAAITATEGAE